MNPVTGVTTKMQLTSHASSPLFDWHSRASHLLTNDAGTVIAYANTGPGFAIRSRDTPNTDRCISVEMAADTTIELVVDKANIPLE